VSLAEAENHLVSPEEYLAEELRADRKHEYVGGVVYAMAGGRIRHHRIASNVGGMLYAQLRGKRCEYFNSDTKVRIRFPTHTRFYYPDAQVVCRSGPPEATFQDEPVVVVEVVSERTRRIDEQEKREGYLSLSSVSVYILLEQKSALAKVWRRTSSGFVGETWEGLQATIPLPEIAAALPLAEIYEGADFASEEDDEESP
jgi:Uma2 family endonuclease